MTHVIRAAEGPDLDGLVRLETAAFTSDRLDRRALRHAIRSPTVLALVAASGSGIDGYGLVQLRSGSRLARLTSLAVSPGLAGKGIGRALLSACEAAAHRASCDRIRLEVRADNDAACRLYDRTGYLRVGSAADYYEDGQTAIRFEKRLG